ncbi:MAG: DNA repair protein RecN, partial [Cyanobacteria bacterium P01_F01_bin.3]
AQGDQHLRVSKQSDADSAQTEMHQLIDTEQRVQEIARMLGGVKITKQTLAHAQEMLGPVHTI